MTKTINVDGSGFKVGDVLVGTSYWGRTTTRWYKVVRTTKCKVVVSELPTSYQTAYGPNTPGSYCMPVMDGIVDKSCPYYFGDRGLESDVMAIVRQSQYGNYVKLPGTYGMCLYHWDGKPGWVNCD